MSLIKHLKGREAIDSRGVPTLEVEVSLENGLRASALVPSGASTGQFEALELRDGDPNYFFGKGLQKSIKHVDKLSQVLKGVDVREQKKIDHILIEEDGTPLKTNLGANTLLGISLACAQGAALFKKEPLYQSICLDSKKLTLPVPLMNVINGGLHGSNQLDIQEFMLVPFDFSSFQEALRAGCEIFHQLKKDLKSKGFSTAVGDEGGFTPAFKSHTQALEFILSAIESCSYSGKVALALDCAASEFYANGKYQFESQKIDKNQLISIYEKWVKDYPLVSIEDGLSEEDWQGWRELTSRLGDQVQLVGDDLFVTQKSRLQKGIEEKIANSLLVKYNQVGTLSETLEAVEMAKKSQYSCVISHRSGETEDTSIADLSVAWGIEQIKTGSLSRGERTAKYNRLLRIEEELGSLAQFKALKAFKKINLS